MPFNVIWNLKKLNNLLKIRAMKKQSFYIGISIATIFMVGMSFCSSHFQSHRFEKNAHRQGNIDTLLQDIKSISGETGLGDLGGLYEDYQTASVVQYADKTYSKKDLEALKKHYLSEASQADKIEFLTELEEKYDVQHQAEFFKRQIRFAKTNLDLAIIGAGIFGVHQTYKGVNQYVKENEQDKYIDFIRDQIQSSIASDDMNYKAIVFRGIYSSFYK